MRAKEFLTPDEINIWAKSNYGEFLKNTEAPIYDKIYEYTGNTYSPINQLLRKSNYRIDSPYFEESFSDINHEYASDAMLIYNYLQNYPLKEDVTVYRFISNQAMYSLLGTYFIRSKCFGQEKAFSSTSLLKSAANEFKKSQKANGFLMKIYVPKGIHALYVSQDDYCCNRLREYELLLEPNLRYTIVKMPLFSREIECEIQKV